MIQSVKKIVGKVGKHLDPQRLFKKKKTVTYSATINKKERDVKVTEKTISFEIYHSKTKSKNEIELFMNLLKKEEGKNRGVSLFGISASNKENVSIMSIAVSEDKMKTLKSSAQLKAFLNEIFCITEEETNGNN